MTAPGDIKGTKIWCNCLKCKPKGTRLGLSGGNWIARRTWFLHRTWRDGLARVAEEPLVLTRRMRRQANAEGAFVREAAGTEDRPNLDLLPERHQETFEIEDTGFTSELLSDEASMHEANEASMHEVIDPCPATPQEGAEEDANCQHDNDPLLSTSEQYERPQEMDLPDVNVTLDDMKTALEFIRLLQQATLDNSGLQPELVEQIRGPRCSAFAIEDPDVLLSIKLYLATANASEDTYSEIRDAIMARFPDVIILSLYKVKKAIEELTGVVGQRNDMCINSCLGYTGPYATLERCPKCGEDRYCPVKLRAGKKVARQSFTSMLPSTQIQAFFGSESVAPEMAWFFETSLRTISSTPAGATSLKEFYDIASSSELLHRVADGSIQKHDVVLMFSIDGAQLYQNKSSDCWMSLWLLGNIRPDKRYKKQFMLPGVIIPGPNHPKDLDSFLFPSFHHVAAVMREGLTVYHATLQERVVSNLFFAFGMADGPGMAMFEGTVGHHGALGCRVLCGLPGRHKANGPHYYPALLKPHGDPVSGCNHDDVLLASLRGPSAEEYDRNLRLLLSARNETQYKQLRKATGLCKPSIVSGLPRSLPIPFCFPPDLMHLTWLNIPDLYLSLWRGTIKGSTQSDPKSWDCAILALEEKWVAHGRRVERAMPYLPGFFDRPPRNIAEKVNSGYKATEYKTWFFNYAPAMLRHELPRAYWEQLCELVRGLTIIFAENILPEELVESKQLLSAAVQHYEALYYARDPDRLHVVRPCVHSVWHAPDMVVLLGALICVTQLPMERLIGDLGSQIKQPSNPFSNLSQRALRRCQENAIRALEPRLAPIQDAYQLPRGACNLGDGYVLLRARDTCARKVPEEEARSFYDYLPELRHGQDRATFSIKAQKWARLQIPDGTVVRSAWKERGKPLNKLRMARCVKFVAADRSLNVAEVRYFCEVSEPRRVVALVSVFAPCDMQLYHLSKKNVQLHRYLGNSELRIIDVKSIRSVVGMIPDNGADGQDYGTDYTHLHEGLSYFVVEKLGFEVRLRSSVDPENNIDE
ncbi:hypothetical protein NUW54_g6368 [Trametes sanguinea]|uniref:Uncharacterized protein n=1 Tax=Trametes sanguinea TaxID=158606 RepID=A0ACC1PSZ4_9APHY|nr:hypothetical protein NUW54_g6368 [Trametes sanguinea]